LEQDQCLSEDQKSNEDVNMWNSLVGVGTARWGCTRAMKKLYKNRHKVLAVAARSQSSFQPCFPG